MKYIVHRGVTSKKIKENSFESIKKAIRDIDSVGVEFDIRLTKDNKIILIHDSLIGLNKVENMYYKDIIKEKYLTTLDRVLGIITDKIFLIDIKTNNNYKIFADTLISYLKDIDRNIYLCSFDKKILNYLKGKTKYKLGHISFFYKNNSFDFFMINYNGISNKKRIKIKNKKLFLWTISSKKELNYIMDKFENIKDCYIIINKEE